MFQIRALNEHEDIISCIEESEKDTEEAEETIVVAEYLRALNYMNRNELESALYLFLELLDTEILNKINHDEKDNLFIVKCNCYRNIGRIYQDKNIKSIALEYLFMAAEMDKTDIHTMYSLAKLAFSEGNIQLAKIYYEKCIELNQNHWPSMDGLLEVYCARGNVIEVYSWAMQCYRIDNTYKLAITVLMNIKSRFASTIPFLEELLGVTSIVDESMNKPAFQSIYNHYNRQLAMDHWQYVQNCSSYTIKKIDWLYLGNLVLNLLDYSANLSQESQALLILNKFVFWHTKTNTDKMIMNETIQSTNPHESLAIFASDTVKQTEVNVDMEMKNRRRGSELKILEQWGWHKNRRSSRKKNVYDITDTTESTADGFIKRVLYKYFAFSYAKEVSPFSGDHFDLVDHSKEVSTVLMCSLKRFSKLSRHDLDSFIQKIQEDNTDLSASIRHYLYSLSRYWNEFLPLELRMLYIKLFNSFIDFENSHSWIQYTDPDITIRFQITLFYLEMQLDFDNERELVGMKRSFRVDFCNILDSIHLYLSHLPANEFLSNVRYRWLRYLVSMQNHNYYRALEELEQIIVFFFTQSELLCINLPNQRHNNFFDKYLIQQLVSVLKRKISLCTVKNLYFENKYDEIVNIITITLIQANNSPTDVDLLGVSCQIEVLLECFWNLENYVECLVWAERAMKYTIDVFMSTSDKHRQKHLSGTINFILDYILALIKRKNIDILEFQHLSRMIQAIHKMLTYLLDSHQDKVPSDYYTLDCSKAWAILYYVLEREDDKAILYRVNRFRNVSSPGETDDEALFGSIMVFFVAHELLGRRLWCSNNNSYILLMMLDVIIPKLRSPLLEPYRDFITECLEQTTHCLYGYPPKKGRTRHIQDHDATHEILTWERAVQLFDIYRPDVLPEYNSYKIDSISADMEAMLKHILQIFPDKCNVSKYTAPTYNFINGVEDKIIPVAFCKKFLCYKIESIHYLLADYYFKSRDFSKAITFYVMDLTVEPTRYDSWAGISLSKASKCETMLNCAEILRCEEYLRESNNTTRCFEQCLKLNETDFQLRVEYGSFAYNVYSFCNRSIKFRSSSLLKHELELLNTQKTMYESITYRCFNMANLETIKNKSKEKTRLHDNNNHEDEEWLYNYMLGKIAEKKKVQPAVYISHYLKSAKSLYDCNATYPIKVNHSNPSHLSIEALELFYRTTVAVMKYAEQNEIICKPTLLLFKNVLSELSTSPFAVNRAKISDITFQRKIDNLLITNLPIHQRMKTAKIFVGNADYKHKLVETKQTLTTETSNPEFGMIDDTIKYYNKIDCQFAASLQHGLRRSSQESIAATTTLSTSNVTSSFSSTTNSVNSEMDSTSESDSDSTTDDEVSKQIEIRDAIYRDCIKNLEECITRFPEHYKSIYRLAHHYLYATGSTRSLERCRELMLGSYKTTLGNEIAGLFTERRNNNFFNGIWRIPSSDIDRPGSFATHLSKCVTLLITTLKLSNDHKTLFDLAFQLCRTPDIDKKYLYESDRSTLYHKAINACIEVFQDSLNHHFARNNDDGILTVLIDVFKAQRKSAKHLQEIEAKFSNVLIDGYKMYVSNKASIPDNTNISELAFKLCTYEINYRKTIDKLYGLNKTTSTLVETATTLITPMRPISAVNIPGLTKQRKITTTKESPYSFTSTTSSAVQTSQNQSRDSLMSPKNITAASSTMQHSTPTVIRDLLPSNLFRCFTKSNPIFNTVSCKSSTICDENTTRSVSTTVTKQVHPDPKNSSTSTFSTYDI